MTTIIIPIDPSTSFLFEIIERLDNIGIEFKVIEVHANEESYSSSLKQIEAIEKGSLVIFLGHGTNEQLYGGENEPDFTQKGLIKKEQMRVFEDQNLFLLSCNSSGLLKSYSKVSKIKKSIGFGALPTSKEEVLDEKKLIVKNISAEELAEKFKETILDITSTCLIQYFNRGLHFSELKDLIHLHIDKNINQCILEENNPSLADLLFNMKANMIQL
ncbi:hypothetical protein [Reichenbachiella versicolor]|uniref:hypothetical protein n=1 Tax=Reichenbachiella versicolor TaxID=1821036 RepID=UPI000D6DC7A7|nr:hypothetical protein [Reichenbachiella versicolor]